jgi:hypothetical protein
LIALKNRSLIWTLPLLLVLASWFHASAITRIGKGASAPGALFVPSTNSLKLLSLGYDELVADCLWLQFIQYIGDKENRGNGRSDVAALMLDEITGLDPHFSQAYFFIASIIGGEQHDPDRADTLLQRGITANPDNWYIPFIAGVNKYLFAHDEIGAARYYRVASKFPSAPTWLSGQVQILESKIPSTVKSINVWQKISESSSEPAVKQRARFELCSLWVHVRNHAPPGSLVRKRAEAELEALGVNIFRK